VGQTDRLPLEGGSQGRRLKIEGMVTPPALPSQDVSFRGVSPDYLKAIGVPLLRGRWLQDAAANGPREVLINSALARLYFSDRNPLGQRVHFDSGAAVPEWFEVVGVVGDLRQRIQQTAQPAEAFVLRQHSYWPMLRFVARAEGDPQTLAGAAREAVRRVAPD
jgi:putative ABC transport system permease protein